MALKTSRLTSRRARELWETKILTYKLISPSSSTEATAWKTRGSYKKEIPWLILEWVPKGQGSGGTFSGDKPWWVPFFCCFPGGSAGKASACNAGYLGSIPGSGRSPGEGNSYPLQYSGLENSMDCKVHAVTKSQTRLSDFHFTSLPPSWPVIGRHHFCHSQSTYQAPHVLPRLAPSK